MHRQRPFSRLCGDEQPKILNLGAFLWASPQKPGYPLQFAGKGMEITKVKLKNRHTCRFLSQIPLLSLARFPAASMPPAYWLCPF
jgi:hypothetical protein